jgi:hypothetical protein
MTTGKLDIIGRIVRVNHGYIDLSAVRTLDVGQIPGKRIGSNRRSPNQREGEDFLYLHKEYIVKFVALSNLTLRLESVTSSLNGEGGLEARKSVTE